MNCSEHIIFLPLEPIVDQTVHVTSEFLKGLPEYQNGIFHVTRERIVEIINLAREKLDVKPSGYTVGGSATAVATVLRQLPGNVCQLFGSLGKRSFCVLAEAYHTALNALNIHTDQLQESEDKPTGHCLCLVNEDGQRFMLINLGAAVESTKERLRAELFENVHHLHVEGYRFFADGFVETAIKLAKERGISVSLDTGNTDVVKINKSKMWEVLRSRCVDIFIGNKDEMTELTGHSDPEEICRALGQFCPTVAVTLGEDGCCIKDKEDSIQRFLAYPATVIDTTGAGDCFTGGLIHGLLKGYPIEKCAHYARTLASVVIAKDGNGITNEEWQSKVEPALADWDRSASSTTVLVASS